MNLKERTETVSGQRQLIRWLTFSNGGLVIIALLLALKLITQSELIILKTPGLPANAVIAKSAMDRASQRATLLALTSNLAQVNPANASYMKAFVQPYLAPATYTRVSKEIDDKAMQLSAQRELGSYYFVFKSYEYDPALDRHFILGDVHTVNAAIDTAKPYVFEYQMHVESYRPVVDDVKTYPGDRAHNTEWLKQVEQKK